jgi:hypothetical protein
MYLQKMQGAELMIFKGAAETLKKLATVSATKHALRLGAFGVERCSAASTLRLGDRVT